MFWKKSPSPEHVYTAIEDDESVGASSVPSALEKQRRDYWRYSRLVPLIAWQIMLSVVMFLAGAAVTAASSPRHCAPDGQDTRPLTDRQCVEQLSVYSPLLDLVEYEQRNWTDPMAGSDSGYVGRPTKEMEKKWDAISQGKLQFSFLSMVAIPYEKLSLLDRVEYGDGHHHGSRFITVPPGNPHPSSPGGYVGIVEVFHHLHCLNILRQYIWIDTYAPPPGEAGTRGEDDQDDERPPLPKWMHHEARKHTDHCVDVLRQALTCNADVTPYLIYKGEGNGGDEFWPEGSREDFESMHKCRKLEPLLEYFQDNGLKIDPPHVG
ncbi:uncharacterized protein PpBr36_10619 [Pyricularia pennisetigena]|uniref:uncharacterized protein n=1 Tax=Pyricularia pennisetigena TaxID=1578925 RepID=UPI00115027C9|nr:uncharacterized protein PpBr36_10619 [Pyricularia pennisetigena]TLS21276.1 hypothetical protein PpBr36_10619 [Pyricularia pennisetigena]